MAGAAGTAIQMFTAFNANSASFQNAYFNTMRIYAAGPAISIVTPTNYTFFFAGSSIGLSANAADANGITVSNVAYYANGAPLGAATSAPYSRIWAGVPTGSYALTAVATDSLNNSATSAVVNITVVPPPAPPNFSGVTFTNIGGSAGTLLTWLAPTNDQIQIQWATNLAPPVAWTRIAAVLTNLPSFTPTNGIGKFQYFDNGAMTGKSGSLKLPGHHLPPVVRTEAAAPLACSSALPRNQIEING